MPKGLKTATCHQCGAVLKRIREDDGKPLRWICKKCHIRIEFPIWKKFK